MVQNYVDLIITEDDDYNDMCRKIYTVDLKDGVYNKPKDVYQLCMELQTKLTDLYRSKEYGIILAEFVMRFLSYSYYRDMEIYINPFNPELFDFPEKYLEKDIDYLHGDIMLLSEYQDYNEELERHINFLLTSCFCFAYMYEIDLIKMIVIKQKHKIARLYED